MAPIPIPRPMPPLYTYTYSYTSSMFLFEKTNTGCTGRECDGPNEGQTAHRGRGRNEEVREEEVDVGGETHLNSDRIVVLFAKHFIHGQVAEMSYVVILNFET